MKKAQQNDALLALISTLAVVFVVLFVSIAYFLTFRIGVNEREAYLNTQLQEMYNAPQNRANYGRVAGYQSER